MDWCSQYMSFFPFLLECVQCDLPAWMRSGLHLLLGAVFFQKKLDTQQAVFTIGGLQYMVLLFVSIQFAIWARHWHVVVP